MTPPEQGSPVGAALRRTRALALAGTVVVLAATSHVLAGGDPPPLALTLGVTGLLYVAANALARRRLPLPVIVTFLAAGQLGLHTVFMLGAGPHMAMSGAAPDLAALTASLTPTMIGAHLVATTVSAAVLARGESALWVVWSFVGRRVLVLVPRYLSLPSAAPVLVPVRVRRTGRALPHDVDRRGPPTCGQV